MNDELKFYEEKGNWDFSKIKYYEEVLKDEFNYFDWIRMYSDDSSNLLDLGTGGGEALIKEYPKIKRIVGIDFSNEMIKTAIYNLEHSKRKNENISFCKMDINNLEFENNEFDIITARHTVINVNNIKRILKPGGLLIIEGVAKDDSIELKEKVGRGQCFFDERAVEEIELEEIKNAGFEILENKYMILNEWYYTEEDFLGLLFKTPIIEDITEKDLEKIKEYIAENTQDGYIKLVRRIYGFICKNIK